ncbi:MAG: aspartate aminotransferase family protein [Paraburkholderia sp.]|uniref:aminotransferase family protein n=1 Tax=Paraburkholderia sp. TaxID=1926495 RepID=UPI0011F780AA|nr:aminotransferase class III-fold pyridoxal phosphate-dependent enzyme [Paraburkholderia sp.]TAL95190.1 MAG: aspartate aminotransferase family protein [Paraburkholderia sp.]
MNDIQAAGRPAVGGPQDLFYSTANTVGLPRIVRGENIYVWDDQGRRLADVSSGAIVSNIGQGNERVLRAMYEQGKKLSFSYVRVSRHDPNSDLSEKLAKLAGPGYERCHFTSGGSEANEMAIKFCRQYAYATGQTRKTRVISCMPSYHGGTLGTIAVTGDLDFAPVYGDMVTFSAKVPSPFTYRVPQGHTAETYALECARQLETTIVELGPENVLCFIFEPVGGLSTGANVPPAAYFREIRRICSRYGVFLVFDEVMAGAGRTGKFLAADHWPEAKPDLIVLAKGLAAGYTPLGAVLAPARLVDELASLTGFNLAHTYNANPITCAGACAVLDETVESRLVENAASMGRYMFSQLRELAATSPIIGDVRGKGFLCAIELVKNKDTKEMLAPHVRAADRVRQIAMEHGMLIYARRTSGGKFGEWFMASPPLITTQSQVDEIVAGIGATLGDLTDELHRANAL